MSDTSRFFEWKKHRTTRKSKEEDLILDLLQDLIKSENEELTLAKIPEEKQLELTNEYLVKDPDTNNGWKFTPIESTLSIIEVSPNETVAVLPTSDYVADRNSPQQSSERSTLRVGDGSWQSFRDTIYAKLTELGYSGETAKAMTGKMGLESGHGKKPTGDYNFSNITTGKSWTGRTMKFNSGNHRTFRSYDSFDEAMRDYVRLNKVYEVHNGDSKEEAYSKWLGHNSKGLAWNGRDNIKYKNQIDEVYKLYWG